MKERLARAERKAFGRKREPNRATGAIPASPKNETNKTSVSMNYESALEYIHAVQWAGHKPGLSRTRTLLAALGDPHKKLRFVHVAGTNGKGSTAPCWRPACRRGGVSGGPVHFAFHQPLQRAHSGKRRTDTRRRAGASGGASPPAADAMPTSLPSSRSSRPWGCSGLRKKKCDIVVLESGPRRYAGLYQRHRPA